MLDILKRIDLREKRFCKKCLDIIFKITYTHLRDRKE
jgi:predicted Zn-dependent protease